MNIITLLIILLVLAAVGVLPTWPYATNWGYTPVGTVGMLIIILLIVLIMRGRV